MESAWPVFSPGTWVWLARVGASLLLLLSCIIYDQCQRKSAIAMVAVSGDTSAGTPEQRKARKKKWKEWALLGRLFRRSKEESHDVAFADTQEDVKTSGQADVKTSGMDAGIPEQPKDKKRQWRKSHWALFGKLFRGSSEESDDVAVAGTQDVKTVMDALRSRVGPRWKRAAAGLLAVYLVSTTLNSVVYVFLSTQSDLVVLGEPQMKEVHAELKSAENQLRADEILGYIPSMSEQEFDEKLREIGSEIENEQKVGLPFHLNTSYPQLSVTGPTCSPCCACTSTPTAPTL